MTTRRRLWTARLLEALVPVGLIALWALWSASAGSFYFPPLGDILTHFRENWLFERLGADVIPSLVRLLVGYLIAAVLGVLLGIPLGLSATARRAVTPIIEFLRAIPPPALIPFAIAVIGIGSDMKIFIIATVCIWPVLLNAIDGVAAIDPTLRDTAQVYGLGRADRIRRVVLPAASPQIFAGMRTALALALIMMVVSEMVASTNGIGFFVLQSQRSFAIADMWSGIVLLGILGYALNVLFLMIERRVLAWHRGARAGSST